MSTACCQTACPVWHWLLQRRHWPLVWEGRHRRTLASVKLFMILVTFAPRVHLTVVFIADCHGHNVSYKRQKPVKWYFGIPWQLDKPNQPMRGCVIKSMAALIGTSQLQVWFIVQLTFARLISAFPQFGWTSLDNS